MKIKKTTKIQDLIKVEYRKKFNLYLYVTINHLLMKNNPAD